MTAAHALLPCMGTVSLTHPLCSGVPALPMSQRALWVLRSGKVWKAETKEAGAGLPLPHTSHQQLLCLKLRFAVLPSAVPVPW